DGREVGRIEVIGEKARFRNGCVWRAIGSLERLLWDKWNLMLGDDINAVGCVKKINVTDKAEFEVDVGARRYRGSFPVGRAYGVATFECVKEVRWAADGN